MPKTTGRSEEEKATAVVKAVFEVLKQCRPFRWGLEGLEEGSPEEYEKLLEEARGVVLKELYPDERG